MKIQQLKILAQQATPWPWKWFTSNSHNRLSSVPGGKDGDVISAFKAADGAACVSISHDDMAFIEAAHPGAVLELIERLEAADKDGRKYAILAGTNAARAEKAERERGELQEQVRALAAEGSQMLQLLTDISEQYQECQSESEENVAVIDLDYISEVNSYVSRDVGGENPFEATDAFLREIRALAVEGFADYIAFYYSGAKQIARYYAARIRAGEQP